MIRVWNPCVANTLLPFSIFVFVLFGVTISSVPARAKDLTIVGWAEKVAVRPGKALISAKIDTGSVNCSLHATDIEEFQRGEQTWTRFSTVDHMGTEVTLEAPLVRMVRIKRHFRQSQSRPVVKLGICLGKIFKACEVNLVDRSGFEFPMLVGRRYMEGDIMVDPSVTFTVEPQCPPGAKVEGPPKPEAVGEGEADEPEDRE